MQLTALMLVVGVLSGCETGIVSVERAHVRVPNDELQQVLDQLHDPASFDYVAAHRTLSGLSDADVQTYGAELRTIIEVTSTWYDEERDAWTDRYICYKAMVTYGRCPEGESYLLRYVQDWEQHEGRLEYYAVQGLIWSADADVIESLRSLLAPAVEELEAINDGEAVGSRLLRAEEVSRSIDLLEKGLQTISGYATLGATGERFRYLSGVAVRGVFVWRFEAETPFFPFSGLGDAQWARREMGRLCEEDPIGLANEFLAYRAEIERAHGGNTYIADLARNYFTQEVVDLTE